MGFHLLCLFADSSGRIFKSPYQCFIPVPWIFPLASDIRCKHEEFLPSHFLVLFLKLVPKCFEVKALHGTTNLNGKYYYGSNGLIL